MSFKMKKVEARTVLASMVFFFLLKIMSDWQMPMSGSIAAVITVLIIIIMNFKKVLPWINFMVIIPATMIISLEVINEFFKDFVLAAGIVTSLSILVVWALFQWAFKSMKTYWENCVPDKPRIKRMKKSLYLGFGIVFIAMLTTSILF